MLTRQKQNWSFTNQVKWASSADTYRVNSMSSSDKSKERGEFTNWVEKLSSAETKNFNRFFNGIVGAPLTPVVPLRHSVEYDKKLKEEKEMYKDISIKQNQDYILMERESPWKKKL